MEGAERELKNKPYLLFLNELIMAGKELTPRDCERFWKAFKDAQMDAFEKGRKSVSRE